jgi:ribosome-associated protein
MKKTRREEQTGKISKVAQARRKPAKAAEGDFLPSTRTLAALAADHKASDIRAYDLRGLTLIADSFVICSASSEPQVKAIHNSVREGMKGTGAVLLRTEGTPACGWLVMDYGDVIFHVFRKEARVFYDLDGLWGDAPQLDLDLDPKPPLNEG